MSGVLSKSQIDRLGDRLRLPPINAEDLRLLDDYRREFAAASAEVERVLRSEFAQRPSSREAKSTPAICAKLEREGMRLSTMQDIAGCRVVVPNREEQQALADALRRRFPDHKFSDRIAKPSHGYRALHVIVRVFGYWVEIQVRTQMQHHWAQVCELLADRVGLGFKYGLGHPALRAWVEELSEAVNALEQAADLSSWQRAVRMFPNGPTPSLGANQLSDHLQKLVAALPVLLGDSP